MTPETGQTMPNPSMGIGETLREQLGQVIAPIQEADASAAAAKQAAEEAAQTAASVRADAQEGVQHLATEVSDAATAIQEVANQLNPNAPGTVDDTPEKPVTDPAAANKVTVFDRIRGSKTATRVFAIGALAAATLVVAYGASKISAEDKGSAANNPALADKLSNSKEKEVQGWEQKELTPNDENRWLQKGFPNIKKADSAEESREAANQWLGVIKGDQDTFAFVASELLDEDVDKNTIFDENGNSTDEAEKLLKKVQLKLAVSSIGKGSASKDLKNPHNTGLNKNGQVVLAKNSGVGGDTEAIIVETPDGKKIAIMHRCAQPVVEGDRPNTPKGPTDEPEPKNPEEEVPAKNGDKQPDHPGGRGDDSDHAGEGPAGQKPGSDGYVPGEKKPNNPTAKPTPAPLEEAPETRDPQAPAQESPIPPTTGPGTPGNGSEQETPTEDVKIN